MQGPPSVLRADIRKERPGGVVAPGPGTEGISFDASAIVPEQRREVQQIVPSPGPLSCCSGRASWPPGVHASPEEAAMSQHAPHGRRVRDVAPSLTRVAAPVGVAPWERGVELAALGRAVRELRARRALSQEQLGSAVRAASQLRGCDRARRDQRDLPRPAQAIPADCNCRLPELIDVVRASTAHADPSAEHPDGDGRNSPLHSCRSHRRRGLEIRAADRPPVDREQHGAPWKRQKAVRLTRRQGDSRLFTCRGPDRPSASWLDRPTGSCRARAAQTGGAGPVHCCATGAGAQRAGLRTRARRACSLTGAHR